MFWTLRMPGSWAVTFCARLLSVTRGLRTGIFLVAAGEGRFHLGRRGAASGLLVPNITFI